MKILASDFDDTIYFSEDKQKTLKNIEKMKDFVQLGNIFCIITGRNYSDLKILLNEYDIPYTYLVCEDGAKIFNNVDYCIDTILLNPTEIESIVPILEENNCDYYLDDGYNQTTNYNDCVKIVVTCEDTAEKDKIVQIVKDNSNVHIYASRKHVNIINESVNKENALKRLFNLEKLDYNLLYVIGDNDNDYEMLKTFSSAVIKKHHPKLNSLKKKEYETLKDYLEELMQN